MISKFWIVAISSFALFIHADVVMITSDNYHEEVLESKIPVVLDAYTDWCYYCQQVAPVFADLSNEMRGKIKFAKVNIDSQPGIGQELNIQALPTFVFFKKGKVVGRQSGALDRQGFKSKFSSMFR